MSTNADKMAAIYTMLPKLLRDKHDLQANGYRPEGFRIWEGFKPDPDAGLLPTTVRDGRLLGLPIEWIDTIEAYIYSKDEVSEIRLP